VLSCVSMLTHSAEARVQRAERGLALLQHGAVAACELLVTPHCFFTALTASRRLGAMILSSSCRIAMCASAACPRSSQSASWLDVEALHVDARARDGVSSKCPQGVCMGADTSPVTGGTIPKQYQLKSSGAGGRKTENARKPGKPLNADIFEDEAGKGEDDFDVFSVNEVRVVS
jgi:hypothetical protein